MATNVEVSRFYEPAPEIGIEARYQFKWMNGEFDSVKLSKRHDKPESNINSQFGKIEDIDLNKVPDDVVKEAQKQLENYSKELSYANSSASNACEDG